MFSLNYQYVKRKIKNLLKENNVDFSNWGITVGSNTLEDLIQSVINKEITLTINNKKVIKQSIGTAILIKYQEGKKSYWLKEEKQVKKDGTEIIRDLKMSMGLRKLKPKETPESGAYRVLKEELGIKQKLELNILKKIVKEERASVLYPGINSVGTDYYFEVFLPKELYKEEGYTKEKKGLKTYFKWRAIL